MHNLKDIDVVIPRNKLVVITGLSGSGKSSLISKIKTAFTNRFTIDDLEWSPERGPSMALHDGPEILPKLRVHWTGGANKKWSPDDDQSIVTNLLANQGDDHE